MIKAARALAVAVIGATLSILTGCATDSTPVASSPPAGTGWVALIDGTNLNAFDATGNANIRLENGVAKAELGAGYLVTKLPYKNFELRAELWVDDVANSGIMIRCTDIKKIGAEACYEMNVFDTRADPTYGTGAIVGVSKVGPLPKSSGKWNTLVIVAEGPHLVFTLNGVKTADAQDSRIAGPGPLALQFGGGVVKFRNVWIRPLN
ncbi:MAG: DUF1080 domain-containing protein [Burkholderiales bacterium]